jgi:isoleucyl-tRNA synthetase
LDTTVSPELAAEGLARDVVRAVQQARRGAGLEVSDRIILRLAGDEAVRAAVEAHAELIKKETLATSLDFADRLDNPTLAVVGDQQRIALTLSAT